MKQRESIKELNDFQSAVVWPEYSASFHHYQHMLKKVIAANFDGPVVKTLEYCEDEKTFYITLTVQSTLAGSFGDNCEPEDHRTGLMLEKLFEINVLEPLGPQIQTGLNIHEAMKDKHSLLQLLYNEHMGQQ